MKTDKVMIGYLLISAAMCVGMTAYVKNGKAVEVRTDSISNVTETEATTEMLVQTTEEEENYDMPVSVKYAFVDDMGIPHVVIENHDEQIYGYTLQIKYFDKDKNELAQNTVTVDSVVPKGLTDGLDEFIPTQEGCKYISASVSELKYLNEEKTYEPHFGKVLTAMSDIKADEVKKLEFIEISSPGIVKQSGGSDLSDIRFDVTNKAGKKMNTIEFLVAEYDKDGKPVSVRPNSYVSENVRKLSWDHADLEVSAKKTVAANMALDSDCTKVEMTVLYVEFSDKSVYKNPNALDWILSKNK